jgi:hypothetical protein
MENSCPVKNPDIVARTEQKEALLFNPVNGDMLCINETGILVWDLCDGFHKIDDIAEKMIDKYEVPSEKAKKDCLAYLKDMKKSGFIGFKEEEN